MWSYHVKLELKIIPKFLVTYTITTVSPFITTSLGIVGKTLLRRKIHLDFPVFKQRPLAVTHKKIRVSSPFKQSTAREVSSTGLFKKIYTSSAYKWILQFKRYPGISLTYGKIKVAQVWLTPQEKAFHTLKDLCVPQKSWRVPSQEKNSL